MAASPKLQDYQLILTNKVKVVKHEVTERFKSFRETLDLKEHNTLDKIDHIFSENLRSIKELDNLRTQTMESKAILSKSVKKSNFLDLDSTLEAIDSQLESLATIEISWKVPGDLWEDLILVDGGDQDNKIDNVVTHGRKTPNLSNDLKDMRIYKGKIYISDKGTNEIKIFKRNGEFLQSYKNARLIAPGSMVIHRDYLYALTDQLTDANYGLIHNNNLRKILLFKISIITLDTLCIIEVNYPYGVIDTNGDSLYLLVHRIPENQQSGIFSNQQVQDKLSMLTQLEKWNFSIFFENSSHLSTVDKYYLPRQQIQFFDMKIRLNEMFILFINSIYLLQSFDLKGNLLRVIIEKEITPDAVSIRLFLQENASVILRDKANSQIQIFSNQGKLIRTIKSADTSHGLESPMCMDIDEAGRLVVSDNKLNWGLQDIL